MIGIPLYIIIMKGNYIILIINETYTFYNIPDVKGWIVWFNCGQVGIRLLI